MKAFAISVSLFVAAGLAATPALSREPVSAPAVKTLKDPALLGVWKLKTYIYNGKPHAVSSGLMVITANYLIADAIYDLSETPKPEPDANANYGTYEIVAPGKLIMQQDMQLHWRGKGGSPLVEGDGTFFNRNVPETLFYTVTGNTLKIRFDVPGDQGWILERAEGEMPSTASKH